MFSVKSLFRARFICKTSRRILRVEPLLPRYALTAEGQSFAIDQDFETSAIGGTTSGTFLWGDGTSSPAVVGSSPVAGPLSVRFDYSLDANNFFASQESRNTLQAIANSVVSKFADQLTAIRPTGTDQWTATFLNPSNGTQTTKTNLTIAANEILVFVGGRPLPANELGRGEVGGFNVTSTSQAFVDSVQARGQTGALAATPTDFGPWGGSIAFSSSATWYFGAAAAGIGKNSIDFASVATHELMHVLGFGLSDSWNVKVSGGFTGANSVAAAGQSPVPLNDVSHWKVGTQSGGRTAEMTPETIAGIRKLPTPLDYAGLQDIGWNLIAPKVRVSASHTYGDNANFPASLTLNGSVFGSTTFPIQANITNSPPVLAPVTNRLAVQGVALNLPALGQFTDLGFGASQATPPLSESFTYVINWGDNSPDSTGSATVDTVGSPGIPTKGHFDGSHVYQASGNYVAKLTVTDDDGGSSQQTMTITVGPPPTLEISVDKSSVFENAGQNAANLTIRRTGFDLASALTVNLSSSDTTELQLPTSVVIPVGLATLIVPIQAVDDALLDGTIRVLLVASVGTTTSNSLPVDVLDREDIILTLSKNTVPENGGAGAVTLTVARSNTDLGQSIQVQLTSSDTTEATLPAVVTLPSGVSNIQVGVNAVDDALFDGNQLVVLSAASAGYFGATTNLTVTDFQPLSLVLQANELNEEDVSKQSTRATISIRSPAPAGGVTLQLATDAPTQLLIPKSVTIPEGSTAVPFQVSVVDDFIPQGRRTVRIDASGNGVTAASIDLVLTDSDPAYWTNLLNPLDVNSSGGPDPLDVLIIINEINFRGSRALNPNTDRDLPFVDTNENGFLDPLDALLIINELNR